MRIETSRLILRSWTDKDRQPFAEMCDDPVLMEYLLPIASREASDGWIDGQMVYLTKHGFCFWAVEAKKDGAFVGAVGLVQVGYEAHFTPAVEVGCEVDPIGWTGIGVT
jgi:ribosomal-protein-alanine N-acetyltransferase